MKKIILVTGGNRGIGYEITKQLASLGHTVILGSRNEEKGKLAAANIPGNVHSIKLEVTNPNDINKMRRYIDKHFGHLDVLVNNAGIGVGSQGSIDPDFNEVKKLMETNFYGAWNVSIALMELLYKSPEGRIINVSSGMGALNELSKGYAGYRISKSSLNALTILMSNELKDKNVSVNAMCPGWVKTDMGGNEAPRTVEQGAETAVWLSTSSKIENGKFFRDKKEIEW